MIGWRAWMLRRIHAHPYRWYSSLRTFAGVARVGPLRCWAVGRKADIAHVLREPALFSSSVMAPADPCLLGADPPAHTRARRALENALSATPASVAEQAALRAAAAFERRARECRELDLMAELARPLPVTVMTAVLGIEPARHRQFASWSHAVVAESSRLPGAAAPPGTRELVAEFDDYVRALVAERRGASGDDAISTLLAAPDGEGLGDDEAASLIRLLLIAGNETTTHLIGNALLALVRHRSSGTAQAGLLEHVDRLVEETLRFDPPVQFVFRCATRAVQVAGVLLPPGSLVMALLGATGREGPRRTRPNRFRPARVPWAHLAFGAGPHACPGAGLARLEARIALMSALRALPALRLARGSSSIVRSASLQLRGLEQLWIQGAG